jgi:phosphate/sulfate permease
MTDPAPRHSIPVSTRLFALLRTMQLAILAMGLFYIGLAEMLRRARIADISGTWPVIGAFGFVEALAVVYMKQTKIPQAEALLRAHSEDRAGLESARKWYVVALAFSAGVSLYGFALRIMGSTFWQAAIFYVTGIALTLYCTPRKPE